MTRNLLDDGGSREANSELPGLVLVGFHDAGRCHVAVGRTPKNDFRLREIHERPVALRTGMVQQLGFETSLICSVFQIPEFFRSTITESDPQGTDFVPVGLHFRVFLQLAKNRDAR